MSTCVGILSVPINLSDLVRSSSVAPRLTSLRPCTYSINDPARYRLQKLGMGNAPEVLLLGFVDKRTNRPSTTVCGRPWVTSAKPRAPRRAVAHDRRELVGEDPGECREVAGPVVGGAEQGADGGLAFGFGIQVAHVGRPLASILGQPSIVPDYDTQPHEPGRQVGRPRLLEVRQVDAAG